MKKMNAYLFILTAFFNVTVFLSQNINTPDLTVDDVLFFLKVQHNVCSNVSMCYFRPSEGLKSNMPISPGSSQNCCPTCSCEDNCASVGNCCPDSLLRNFLPDGSIFSSLDELNDKFNASIKTTSVDPSIFRKVANNETSLTECLAEDGELIPLYKAVMSKRESYSVVTSCPLDFTDKHNSNYIIEQNCETSITESNETAYCNFWDYIPVMSLRSNLTYKNVNCFRCHENHNSYKSFTVYITSSLFTKAWDAKFIENISYLVNLVIQKKWRHHKVEFKPPNDLKQNVQRCKTLTLAKCPTDVFTYTDRLDKLCATIDLPFVWRNATTVRNAACFQCSYAYKTIGNGFCLPPSKPQQKSSLEIYENSTLLEHDLNLIPFTTDVPNEQQPSRSCGEQFIYDPFMNLCRRRMCPTLTADVNGTCLPLYGKLENIYITAFIELTIPALSKQNRLRFTNILKKVLLNNAAIVFQVFRIVIWARKGNTETESKFTVKINFNLNSQNNTYLNSIVALKGYLRLIDKRKLRIDQNTTITLSTQITSELVFKKGSNSSTVKTTKAGLDFFILFVSNTIFPLEMANLQIRAPYTCDRVVFNSSEVIFLKKNTFVINNSSVIYVNDLIQTKRGIAVLACRDHYLEKSANKTNRKSISKRNVRRESTKSLDFNNYVLVAFGGLALLIALVSIFRGVKQVLEEKRFKLKGTTKCSNNAVEKDSTPKY